MNTVEVFVPPEVAGALSIAQKHMTRASHPVGKRLWQQRERARKHIAKVAKLAAKAARMLAARGQECP